MATLTTAGSGNWSSTTPNAPWVSGTKPTTGDVVEIAAGHTLTLDENTPTLGAAGIKNVAGSNTSVLDISGTVIINGNVSHTGTATAGFVTLGTGDSLTVNGQSTNSGSGYLYVVSASATLVLNNPGANVLTVSAGRGINTAASATGLTITITGNWAISAGFGIQVGSSSTGGTVTISGNVITSVSGTAWSLAASTINWIDACTIADGEHHYSQIAGGTLNLGTSGHSLVVTNSGTFVIHRSSGTLNTTGSGWTAAVNQQVAPSATVGSYAAILGGTAAQKGIISAPTIPAVGTVLDSVDNYGYPGALQNGTYAEVAAGNVRVGVQYGAAGTQYTGTAPLVTMIGD
jgi:hypothetical protein